MVSVRSNAITEPSEKPATAGLRRPMAVMNPDAASAQSASTHPLGTSSDAPHPGVSQATTSICELSRSNSSVQTRASSNAPWNSTSGGPVPRRR